MHVLTKLFRSITANSS